MSINKALAGLVLYSYAISKLNDAWDRKRDAERLREIEEKEMNGTAEPGAGMKELYRQMGGDLNDFSPEKMEAINHPHDLPVDELVTKRAEVKLDEWDREEYKDRSVYAWNCDSCDLPLNKQVGWCPRCHNAIDEATKADLEDFERNIEIYRRKKREAEGK